MSIDGYYDSSAGKSYLIHEGKMWEIEPSRFSLCIYGEVIEWGVLKLSLFERILFWLTGLRGY